VGTGRLHRIHRGVYAVGHRGLGLHGRWMAAVQACGEGAVLSHGSAAVLWELLRPIDGPVHVSIPAARTRRSHAGIHLHRCPSLARGGLVTRREGIPVTTISRTVADLEGVLPARLVRRARRQAEHKGVRLAGVEGRRLRSDLEEEFLALLHTRTLPLPEANVKVGRWEVDFLWARQRVAVEIDSFTYHRGSVAFDDDRARDLDLRQAGFTVLRFSERQLEEEPGRVVADVARALGTGASGG
jgi:very-short-patch-repair endonuclease